jgi:hypothetical protein
MGETVRPKHRISKRVAVGVVGFFVLLYVVGFFVPAPARRGRLPDLSATRSPSRRDAKLSHVVSVLADRGVDVSCWSQKDWRTQAAIRGAGLDVKLGGPWAAFTSYSPYLSVELSPEICVELSRLVRLRGPVWNDKWRDALALAVGALAHESIHARGYTKEALAECWGMQTIPTAAVELGRSRREGRYLAQLYWRLWFKTRPGSYRSSECHDGGRLDLRLRSDVWP